MLQTREHASTPISSVVFTLYSFEFVKELGSASKDVQYAMINNFKTKIKIELNMEEEYNLMIMK
jgi:hypothetical protein